MFFWVSAIFCVIFTITWKHVLTSCRNLPQIFMYCKKRSFQYCSEACIWNVTFNCLYIYIYIKTCKIRNTRTEPASVCLCASEHWSVTLSILRFNSFYSFDPTMRCSFKNFFKIVAKRACIKYCFNLVANSIKLSVLMSSYLVHIQRNDIWFSWKSLLVRSTLNATT